jgi:16S rRNA (uracil1498-N3)-methyltransferase
MLGGEVARHLRALRLDQGSSVRVTDGQGSRATATIHRVARDSVQLDVLDVAYSERGPEVHVMVPVADKDRMLWLAEKAVELGITSWRPVLWKRSRSVASRGEGPAFRKRLWARMISALEQSGGAWLPDIHPEATVDRAIAAASGATRVLLDAAGGTIDPAALTHPAVFAVGPEGGIEVAEKALFAEAGFALASIARNTLRFETAAIAALVLAGLPRGTVNVG